MNLDWSFHNRVGKAAAKPRRPAIGSASIGGPALAFARWCHPTFHRCISLFTHSFKAARSPYEGEKGLGESVFPLVAASFHAAQKINEEMVVPGLQHREPQHVVICLANYRFADDRTVLCTTGTVVLQ